MNATFEPLDNTEPFVLVAQPQTVKTPKDPWFRNVSVPNLDLNYLAFGHGVTQTPEYQAANLPPYNGGAPASSGNLLSHFLL